MFKGDYQRDWVIVVFASHSYPVLSFLFGFTNMYMVGNGFKNWLHIHFFSHRLIDHLVFFEKNAKPIVFPQLPFPTFSLSYLFFVFGGGCRL